MNGKGVLDFHISYVCTHACVFCEQSADMRRFREAPVTAAEIVRVLAQTRRRGFQYVLFSGGEPTLHPRFLGVLGAARSLGFRTAAISNGWRLAEPGFAGRALPLLDDVWLSVHGDTPGLHDRLTGKPGALAHLLRAFENAGRHGHARVLTSTTAMKANWDRIPDILRLVGGFKGVRCCVLSQLYPDGAGRAGFQEQVIPIARWRERIPGWVRWGRRRGIRMLFCGLPLCATGYREDWTFEGTYYPAASIGRLSGWRPAPGDGGESRPAAGLSGLFESDCSAPGKSRVKPSVCTGCARRGACGGVPRRYLKRFGAGELRPLRA